MGATVQDNKTAKTRQLLDKTSGTMKGFTVVELAIVMVIIGLIIAAALPSLRTYKNTNDFYVRTGALVHCMRGMCICRVLHALRWLAWHGRWSSYTLRPLLSPGSSVVRRVASAEPCPVPLAVADGQASMTGVAPMMHTHRMDLGLCVPST